MRRRNGDECWWYVHDEKTDGRSAFPHVPPHEGIGEELVIYSEIKLFILRLIPGYQLKKS